MLLHIYLTDLTELFPSGSLLLFNDYTKETECFFQQLDTKKNVILTRILLTHHHFPLIPIFTLIQLNSTSSFFSEKFHFLKQFLYQFSQLT